MQEAPANIQESRVKKTLLNARVNLIFYFLSLILSFFSRKIFLDCLGADFIGLIGTLINLLGFLNLAELGIGSAIGYVLYKPIFNKDQQKINEIISVMGYLYRWIGLIILGCGIILSCFLPLIFPTSETGFNYLLIYLTFYTFLASSLIGYFINYRQNLLGADQKNYVVTAYFQSTNIIKILIQMAVAYYTKSYFLWIAIEFLFGIIYSVILNYKINQTYPWLKTNIKSGKTLFKSYPEVIRYTRQLFIHQINSFAQFQATPLLTYAFVSLNTVACLGNYTMLFDKLIGLSNTVLGSSSASVGNLIAEGNTPKILNIFWRINILRSFIAACMAFGSYIGFSAFINAWLGKEYILPNIVLILIILKLYILTVSGGNWHFIYGYGLFADIWSSIAESVIFLFLAIIGGHYWGLTGILFAGVVSTFLIVGLWKPYYLYNSGFKKSVWLYWRYAVFINFINAVLIGGSVFIFNKLDWHFSMNPVMTLLEMMTFTIIFGVVTVLAYYGFLKEVRDVLNSLFANLIDRLSKN